MAERQPIPDRQRALTDTTAPKTRVRSGLVDNNLRRRGRPKGTGINDQATLIRVADLLSADSRLKPTTAIRKLGISDPSIIRRLRDKLRTPMAAIAAAPRAIALVTSAATKSTKPSAKPRPRKSATRANRSLRSPNPVQGVAQQAQPEPQPAPALPLPVPLTPSDDIKARETALLAAYLQAMMQSAPPQPEPPLPMPAGPTSVSSTPPIPTPAKPEPTLPAPQATQSHPFAGFSMPGMPAFLQPFQHKPAAQGPQTGPATGDARQLDAIKLAIEATTAIAKLQLHITENAMSFSPMALMLQGQSVMGQMMIASLTGQLGSMQRHLTPKKD
jgi:hypothetical protein